MGSCNIPDGEFVPENASTKNRLEFGEILCENEKFLIISANSGCGEETDVTRLSSFCYDCRSGKTVA